MALTVTAVTATAAALTVPASAALPIPGTDVSLPGVATSPTGITGTNSGTVAATSSSGGVLTCVDSGSTKALVAAGTIKVGVNLPYAGIASVTSATFSNCAVSGQFATVTAQNLPWSIDTSPTTAGGVTNGTLRGVKVTVNIPSIPCSATFQGPSGTNGFINGTHTDPPASPAGSPSTLNLPFGATNNLIATAVSGTCPPNIVKNNDTATLAGTIKLKGVSSTLNKGPTINAHT
ncbi:hypothetical protein [Actinomadura verrucosospora]